MAKIWNLLVFDPEPAMNSDETGFIFNRFFKTKLGAMRALGKIEKEIDHEFTDDEFEVNAITVEN